MCRRKGKKEKSLSKYGFISVRKTRLCGCRRKGRTVKTRMELKSLTAAKNMTVNKG